MAFFAGVAVLAASATDCGKIPCATDDSVCGQGGRCNQELGVCEAIPGGGQCDISPFGTEPAEAALSVDDVVLSPDPLDKPGCLGFEGDPYSITFDVTFNAAISVDFTGGEIVFSADGAVPQNCSIVESFQLTQPGICDGTETCFVRCRTCFDGLPEQIGVQVRQDDGSDAPLSVGACVDMTKELVDTDCDALPDIDEGILGTEPDNADTDNDGLPDGVEISAVFCGVAACNGSCALDEDPSTSTELANPDTDNDGVLDGDEDTNSNGVVDGDETDPNAPGGE